MTKATPHNSGTHLACRIFRHIAQKSSAIHKVFPQIFGQSDENSDCAICAPELCGVALITKSGDRRNGYPISTPSMKPENTGKETENIKKRILAMLLAVIMIVGLLPVTALAAVEYFEFDKATETFICLSERGLSDQSRQSQGVQNRRHCHDGLSEIGFSACKSRDLYLLYLYLHHA